MTHDTRRSPAGQEFCALDDPYHLLVLRAVGGRRLAKRWKIADDGELLVDGYDRARTFAPEVRAVVDLRSLRDLLLELDGDPAAAVVRAGLRAEVRGSPRIRRLLYARDGQPATLEDVPRSWVYLDVDSGVYPPEGLELETDPLGCARYLLQRLGEVAPELAGASAVVQWSASAGMVPGGALRAHVWLWLTEPVDCAELIGWAQWRLPRDGDGLRIDLAGLRPAQIIYTARPRFGEGVEDPLPGQLRLGLVPGRRDAVRLPRAPEESTPTSRSRPGPRPAPAPQATPGRWPWPEPGQGYHEATLSLAGALLREGWDEAEVARVMTAGVPPRPRPRPREVVEAVRDTARALERGQAVTGWRRLGQLIGPEAVDEIRRDLGLDAEGRGETDEERLEAWRRSMDQTALAQVDVATRDVVDGPPPADDLTSGRLHILAGGGDARLVAAVSAAQARCDSVLVVTAERWRAEALDELVDCEVLTLRQLRELVESGERPGALVLDRAESIARKAAGIGAPRRADRPGHAGDLTAALFEVSAAAELVVLHDSSPTAGLPSSRSRALAALLADDEPTGSSWAESWAGRPVEVAATLADALRGIAPAPPGHPSATVVVAPTALASALAQREDLGSVRVYDRDWPERLGELSDPGRDWAGVDTAIIALDVADRLVPPTTAPWRVVVVTTRGAGSWPQLLQALERGGRPEAGTALYVDGGRWDGRSLRREGVESDMVGLAGATETGARAGGWTPSYHPRDGQHLELAIADELGRRTERRIPRACLLAYLTAVGAEVEELPDSIDAMVEAGEMASSAAMAARKVEAEALAEERRRARVRRAQEVAAARVPSLLEWEAGGRAETRDEVLVREVGRVVDAYGADPTYTSRQVDPETGGRLEGLAGLAYDDRRARVRTAIERRARLGQLFAGELDLATADDRMCLAGGLRALGRGATAGALAQRVLLEEVGLCPYVLTSPPPCGGRDQGTDPPSEDREGGLSPLTPSREEVALGARWTSEGRPGWRERAAARIRAAGYDPAVAARAAGFSLEHQSLAQAAGQVLQRLGLRSRLVSNRKAGGRRVRTYELDREHWRAQRALGAVLMARAWGALLSPLAAGWRGDEWTVAVDPETGWWRRPPLEPEPAERAAAPATMMEEAGTRGGVVGPPAAVVAVGPPA